MNIKLLAVLLVAVLPTFAVAEPSMQNSDPNPAPVTEPTLGHHMQNRDPNAESDAAPVAAPEHVMRNTNPATEVKKTEVKKRISTNAAALEDPKK